MDDDNAVGAEVAVIPKGLAGDEVGMGESMGQAVKVPGIVKPPYVADQYAWFPHSKPHNAVTAQIVE